ncbi:3-phosphoshikimate 1-carboxyvinyltransferase [Alphaproteobacteria bacterium]|jgi:3-phosphoshikimate 1-carboxyvinyltransferase|nr:3-phosphoshikimate 1-carboxyvinyltransferase [Alphaproteobacteria bacterium]
MISNKIKDGIVGNINIPSDKSISHRSIIIPSISEGISEINNLLMSDDVLHTLNALKTLGVKIEKSNKKIIIYGKGLNSLKKPIKNIYLGNSGTSARLLTGLLASQTFESILEGDQSLSSRPMKRVMDPLKLMGAEFQNTSGTLPLKIIGKKLKKSKIEIEIPSAQIKSGLILAALNTDGISHIIEKNITRDHTENMLKSFGADINIKKNNNQTSIYIKGKQELRSNNIDVPSDLSSSAFFIVAALINKGSKINLNNININPSRDGILKALKRMGAMISTKNQRTVSGEIVADLEVEYSNLVGCELDADMAKFMIDEYPILSIAAAFSKGTSIFRGLKELKVKESDRLELIRLNLINCGCDCEVINDDLIIKPSEQYIPKNNKIRTDFDHRIAMSFAVMGSKVGNLIIDDAESINTSFPNFIEKFNSAGGNIL